jgi:YHS domain-containing protein
MMKKNRLVFALALIVAFVATAALPADKNEKKSEDTQDKVVVVLSKNVCMINDRSMANDQIPVEIDGKTYYGCCPMCKERLVKDETSRYAIDPVSGKKVDKAKAVIGALPGAAVLYFENEANLQKYNDGERAKSK